METVGIAPQEKALLLQTGNVGIFIIFISIIMKYVLSTQKKSQIPCDAPKLRPSTAAKPFTYKEKMYQFSELHTALSLNYSVTNIQTPKPGCNPY